LFIGMFMAGAVAIVALKLWGVPQLLVTAPPAVLILIYAVLVSQVRYFRLREDRAGDNCYYLGFLFTLCSLVITLIQFLGQRDTDELIGNFGIALVTTIVGIACRVLLGQFREDPLEIEQEVRAELAEAAGRFKAALDSAVVDLDTFRRANQQAVQDAMVQHRAFFAEHAELLSGATRATMSGVAAAAEEFTGHAAAFNAQAKRVVAALAGLDAKIAAIQVPQDILTRHLAPLSEAVDQLARLMGERASLEGRSAEAIEQLLARLNSSGAQLADRHGQLLALLDAMRPAAVQLREAVSEQAELTARHVRELAVVLDGDRGGSAELRAEAQRGLKALVAGLDAWRRAMSEAETEERSGMGRRRAALEQEHTKMVAGMAAHRQALQEQLELGRALLRQFEGGLVAVADAITRRVDGSPPPGGRA
jgi:hypothetical protein